MNSMDDHGAKHVQMTAAELHRQLDPTIQSFLDRVWESNGDLHTVNLDKFVACVPNKESYQYIEHQEEPDLSWRIVRPSSLPDEPNPFILYLCRCQQDGVDGWATHGTAALSLATKTKSVLIFAEIHRNTKSREAVNSIRAVFGKLHLDAENFGFDPSRWVMIADGDSAFDAVKCLVTLAHDPIAAPLGLTLITPVLDPAIDGEMAYCLTCLSSASALTDLAPSLDELRLLPPTLIILAGVDPFRMTGEAFAQRLVVADVETVSVCILGAIHDFGWLAPVLDAPVVIAGQSIVQNTICTAFNLVKPVSSGEMPKLHNTP